MKKKILSLFIGVLGFFFFSCFKVSASTYSSVLNFDLHEHFNFYYEMIHNTEFYKMISRNGNNFSNYLKSYYNDASEVFFAYSDDLDSIMQSHVPEGSKYVIIMTNPRTYCYLTYSNDFYSFSCPSTAQYNETSYLFYDENANFLSQYTYSYNASLHLNLSARYKNYVESEFVYIMGSYYGNLNNLSSSGLTWSGSNSHYIRIDGVQINNTNYELTESDLRSGLESFFHSIGSFFRSVFGKDEFNLKDVGLDYFVVNYVIGEYRAGSSNNVTLAGIYRAFSYSSTFNYSVSVPNGYSSQSFNYNNRYFLVPNSNTCSNSELLLYFNTSDISTINFISYDMLSDELSVDSMKTYSFQLKNANSIEVLSLHSVVGSYDNIIKNFYLISSSDNFGTNTFYYNPVCYSSYSAIDSNDLTFTNINTGNQVTITPAEKQLIIYNSNETIDNIIAESDLNLTDIISGAWNGSKTFISASYYILSMSTTLFTSLPNEVKGVLLCVFTVGMIVILWKVFRS